MFSRIPTEYGDLVNLRIQSECGKIRTRKNSLFGHFSRSGSLTEYFAESQQVVASVRMVASRK